MRSGRVARTFVAASHSRGVRPQCDCAADTRKDYWRGHTWGELIGTFNTWLPSYYLLKESSATTVL